MRGRSAASTLISSFGTVFLSEAKALPSEMLTKPVACNMLAANASGPSGFKSGTSPRSVQSVTRLSHARAAAFGSAAASFSKATTCCASSICRSRARTSVRTRRTSVIASGFFAAAASVTLASAALSAVVSDFSSASHAVRRFAACPRGSALASGRRYVVWYVRVSTSARRSLRMSYPPLWNSRVRRSSTAGCVGGLSGWIKSTGCTRPRPKTCAQSRLAALRANRSLVPSVAAFARSARRLCFGTGFSPLSGFTRYSSPLAIVGSVSAGPRGNRGATLSAASPVNTDLKLASPSAFSAMNLTLVFLSPCRCVRLSSA